MPGTNYSPEEFEETEQALAGVNENIEGHKTVVELRKLIDSKEDLENMRMELIGEAQTEARFTNIFIDTFDEQFRLGEKAGLNLEDFLIKYEEGVQTFLRRLPHEVAGVRDDELGMALEYALTILDKEDDPKKVEKARKSDQEDGENRELGKARQRAEEGFEESEK